MAENDNKIPPTPPGMPYQYPGGPWPSVFPPHKKEDGKWPRPPMPWHNDTEPVVGVYPWENCCEDQDPCMCVTSADVEKWDGTHEVVSANSAAWGGEYDDSWKNSAALWQGASETVNTHSAYWDSAWSIASGYDPNALDPIISILSGTSAFLRTYTDELEVKTKEWIKGNGSANNPIQLSQGAVDRLRNVQELITQLYGGSIDENTRKWLKTNDLDEFVEWLKALDALMFMVDPNMIDYASIIEQMDKDITSPSASILGASGGGIFIQLNKIWAILRNMENWVVETTKETVAQWSDSADKWNWTWDAVNSSADKWEASYSAVAKNSAYWASGSHETWKYEADMTPQNAAQFNAPGVFYYNEN